VPTYQYACTSCGEQLEVVQAFSDEPLTECPACGGRLRKVFHSVGVVFKGSGFYRTDSRGSSSAKDAAGTRSTASSGEASGASSPPAGGTSTGSTGSSGSSGSPSGSSGSSSSSAASG
jgi:putative FmdB family regulatory protein